MIYQDVNRDYHVVKKLAYIFVVLYKFLHFASPISRSWNGLEYLRGIIIGRVMVRRR